MASHSAEWTDGKKERRSSLRPSLSVVMVMVVVGLLEDITHTSGTTENTQLMMWACNLDTAYRLEMHPYEPRDHGTLSASSRCSVVKTTASFFFSFVFFPFLKPRSPGCERWCQDIKRVRATTASLTIREVIRGGSSCGSRTREKWWSRDGTETKNILLFTVDHIGAESLWSYER